LLDFLAPIGFGMYGFFNDYTYEVICFMTFFSFWLWEFFEDILSFDFFECLKPFFTMQ
jgi:hypothetical protein